MTFPKQARVALSQTDTSTLPGVLAVDGLACAGAKFHSPNPLLLNEVEVHGEIVLLCGTCQANLHVLQHLMDHNDDDLSWPVLRDFGNRIRALALGTSEDDGVSRA